MRPSLPSDLPPAIAKHVSTTLRLPVQKCRRESVGAIRRCLSCSPTAMFDPSVRRCEPTGHAVSSSRNRVPVMAEQQTSEEPARVSATNVEIRTLARRHAVAAIRSLAAIAINGKTEPARVAASKAILERAFGRPSHAMTDEAEGAASQTKLTDRDRANA